ncbi:hypothetical protein HII28_19025 [Planctomonas sp. JC2975]|uniref:hypothetical protein n=1 Tax=Planctomonas sp. JC2975 TaxID=2729626 RepID=UPI0014741772|nr:hypothetical protein [Planctomonas sp. JC2975]NNC13959.1 hypothetical protein [Planctomonas sp. JC2975]
MSDSTRPSSSDDAGDSTASAAPLGFGDTDENPTLPTVPLTSRSTSGSSGSGGHANQDADTERLGTAPHVPPTESTPVGGAQSIGTPRSVDDSATGESTIPMDTLFGTGSVADAVPPARPRVRSGAIAWGLIVILASAALIALTAVPAAARWFEAWANSLTPAGLAIVAVVVVGAFVLLLAGLSAIRGAQRRAAERGR